MADSCLVKGGQCSGLAEARGLLSEKRGAKIPLTFVAATSLKAGTTSGLQDVLMSRY